MRAESTSAAKLTVNPFAPRVWERAVCCLAVYLLFFGGYVLVNRRVPLASCMDFSTALDRATPFWPEFVWLLFAEYALVLLPALVARTRPMLLRIALAFTALVVVSLLLFVLVPTQVPRPATLPASVSGSLVAEVFRSDRPVCGFPSLHVSGSVLGAAVLFRERRLCGWLFLPVAAATSISTLLVKQHVVLDLVGGAALALVIERLVIGLPCRAAAGCTSGDHRLRP